MPFDDKKTPEQDLARKLLLKDLALAGAQEVLAASVMAARGDLSKEQLEILLKALPDAIEVVKGAFDLIKEALQSAERTESEALIACREGVEGAYRVLEALAETEETPELRARLAEMAFELGKLSLITIEDVTGGGKWLRLALVAIAGGILSAVLGPILGRHVKAPLPIIPN